MDRCYSPRESIANFDIRHAEQQVRETFTSEFGKIKGSIASSMGIAACGKEDGQSFSSKLVKYVFF
jgi:hypothetical protein